MPKVERVAMHRIKPRRPQRVSGWFVAVAGFLATVVVSCGPSEDAAGARAEGGAGFDRRFETLATVELQEPSSQPLAEIRAFSEAANGDLLVAERWSSRVMRYDPTGTLLGEFGTHGDGPFEFRGVDGILETTDGDVIVIDRRLSRITVLDAALRPDTQFTFFPTPTGEASRLGRGYVLSVSPGPRQSGIRWVSDEWGPVWSVSSPAPASIMERPYWGGYGTSEFVTSSQFLILGYSLYYPLYIYRPPGVLIDTVGQPSTFRVAPIVPAGAFTGPDGPSRREEWFRAFDVIAKLAVIADTLLVVTHGALHRSTATNRTWTEHLRLDAYNLNTRRKILDDVALPEGSRVLGGGKRGLYVLVAEPPAPWTVRQVIVREAGGSGR